MPQPRKDAGDEGGERRHAGLSQHSRPEQGEGGEFRAGPKDLSQYFTDSLTAGRALFTLRVKKRRPGITSPLSSRPALHPLFQRNSSTDWKISRQGRPRIPRGAAAASGGSAFGASRPCAPKGRSLEANGGAGVAGGSAKHGAARAMLFRAASTSPGTLVYCRA